MKIKVISFCVICMCAILCFDSCNQEGSYDSCTNYEQSVQENLTEQFEKEFISRNKLSTRAESLNSVYLVGYTTIECKSDLYKYLKRMLQNDDYPMKDSYCVLDSSIRIYYPLRDAVILYDNRNYYGANHEGLLTIDGITNIAKIKLAGRKPTEHSVATKLYSTVHPDKLYKKDNAIIFDLGVRYRTCEENAKTVILATPEEGDSKKVSCTNNHKKTNCSLEFPQWATGNCSLEKTRCMDYNGPMGDCTPKVTALSFPGSDCCISLSHGECWNEIGMGALMLLTADTQ